MKTLLEFVNDRKKGYVDKPAWMWEDEGLIYAVMDYHSSKGEFSEEDINYLKQVFPDNYSEIIEICEEKMN